MENKNQLIGCCGLDCETCDARIATLTNNNDLREKTAALWTKLNGVTITPEMINCMGCRIDGVKTPFCDKLCPIHNCVREKGLETCADCEQMEECPTLGQIAASNPFVFENLKRVREKPGFQHHRTCYETIITYGSRYGSAEHYARKFSECTGFPVIPYREVKSVAGFDRVIHFGALYAGGVLGLRQLVPLLSQKTMLVIVTVGLADVRDEENIQNIRNSVRRQIPDDIFRRTRIFHLRGAIDYGRLNLKHRTMMALLYSKARGLPEEKKNAETRAMIETYGKQVSFVDDTALNTLKETLSGRNSL